MVSRLPHIIDLEMLEFRDMTIQDWVTENNRLMDELVSEGAEILMGNPDLDSVDLLELWFEEELAAVIELNRGYLDEALENNMNNWVVREEYMRAARSRDLLAKIKNSK
jgi:hypothetical protein